MRGASGYHKKANAVVGWGERVSYPLRVEGVSRLLWVLPGAACFSGYWAF